MRRFVTLAIVSVLALAGSHANAGVFKPRTKPAAVAAKRATPTKKAAAATPKKKPAAKPAKAPKPAAKTRKPPPSDEAF